MNVLRILQASTEKPGLRRFFAACACLMVAASYTGCGPQDEETELTDVEESVPAPDVDREGPPLEPGASAPEEVPPETAPLGPELEAPPPDEVEPETEVPPAEDLEPEIEAPPPEELEPEIEEAEPVPPAPAPLAVAENHAAGRQVFLDQRCSTCHSVSTADVEAKVASGPTAGGDLAGVGARRDRASIEAVLRQEETVNGKRHPKRFSGSQEDLDALIDWLLSQE